MVDERAHAVLADVALTDVGVFVLVRPALVFRVVEVDTGEVLDTDDLVELRERLVDGLGCREVVARGEHMGRVETELDILVRAFTDRRQMLELAAEFRPATRIRLDQHRDALGDVEVVQHARGVVEAPSTPAPVWAPRWTLTYSMPSFAAISTSVCMESSDFCRRSSFGVQRFTRYDEWMTHGPTP